MMSLNRKPFQLTPIDAAERNWNLSKRFGGPFDNKMHVNVEKPCNMDMKESGSISPRPQHRVPKIASELQGEGKPKIRVVPIEIEGVAQAFRQRTLSGPARFSTNKVSQDQPNANEFNSSQNILFGNDSSISSSGKLRDHDVPVQNDLNDVKRSKLSNSMPKQNDTGHNTSTTSLKRIKDILKEFKSYELQVEAFSGNVNSKQYRYLDEMLTRCMINLDDIETKGIENIRAARKAAIKQVQICINLLESKIKDSTISNMVNDDQIERKKVIDNVDSVECDTEMKDTSLSNPCLVEGLDTCPDVSQENVNSNTEKYAINSTSDPNVLPGVLGKTESNCLTKGEIEMKDASLLSHCSTAEDSY